MNVSKNHNLYHETLSKWMCEFQSSRLEQHFLQSKLKQDKRVARFLISVVGIILLLILFSDKMIIKDEYWPSIALGWRGGLVFVCAATAFLVKYTQSVRQFQVVIVSFVALLFVNLQAMVVTYDDDYVLHVFFDVIILIAIYFSTLFSFKASCVLGIAYGVVGTIVVAMTKTVELHSIVMVFVAYLAANLTGIIISAQEHLLKRRLYIRNERLKELAKELKEQAFKDALTQLPNRRAFDDYYPSYQKVVRRLFNSPENVCVAVSDIDFFKRVNDTYGHDVGDSVLIEFSQLLLNSLRPTDEVFRFGGEEFVIILLQCSEENAQIRLNEIIKRLSENIFNVEEIDFPITASFGLAFLQPGEDKKSIIARADMALYKAKENGRNQLVIGK